MLACPRRPCFKKRRRSLYTAIRAWRNGCSNHGTADGLTWLWLLEPGLELQMARDGSKWFKPAPELWMVRNGPWPLKLAVAPQNIRKVAIEFAPEPQEA